MKRYQTLLIALILAVGATVPAASSEAGITINLGDRGYYNRGAYYYDGGSRYDWVPGHWGPRHHWIHGHYRHH